MEPDAKPNDWDHLTTDEKIRRVQDLWDDILESGAEDELTDEQRKEIERRERIVDEAPPGSFSTWEELRRRLETRK